TYSKLIVLVSMIVLLLPTLLITAQDNTECEDGFRLFDHELLATDPVCIPETPQRIISLERLSFETLMSINYLPVATASGYLENFVIDFPTISDRIESIEDIGTTVNPNAESLLDAQPDLIFGSGPRTLELYDELSSIAPTLLFEFDHSGQWLDIAAFVADAIGAEDAYQRLLADYEARLDALRDELGGNSPIISVVRIRPSDVRLYVTDSFSGQVINSANLPRPTSQDYTSDEMQAEFGQQTFYPVSRENIPMADGDIIFVWITGYTPEIAAQAIDRLETLQTDPLWGALEAVQNGNLIEVGGYWIGSSFIAAHYMLDDLFVHVAGVDPQDVSTNPFLDTSTEINESGD
ncbi:MAG: iron-siderophore ABC transporter substrate-binding protein, partial [Chloroflexota bacterium]